MRFSHNGLDTLMDGELFYGVDNRKWLDNKLSSRSISYVHRIDKNQLESDINYLLRYIKKEKDSILVVIYEDGEAVE